MTYLLLETALLMLGAYLLGAVLACLFKRTFAAKPIESGAGGGSWHAPAVPDTQVTAMTMARSAPEPVKPLIETIPPARPDPERFERALTGTGSAVGFVPPPEAASPNVSPPPAATAEAPPASGRAPGSTEIPRPAEPAPISPPSRTPEPLVKATEAEAEAESREAVRHHADAAPSATEPQPETSAPAADEASASEPAAAEHSDSARVAETQPEPSTSEPLAAEPEPEPAEAAPAEETRTEEASAAPEASAPEPAATAEDTAEEPQPESSAPAPETAEPTPEREEAPAKATAEAQPEQSATPDNTPVSEPAPVSASAAMAAAAAAAAAVTGAFRTEPPARQDTAPPPTADDPTRIRTDDLTRIRTIGPLLQKRLNDSGVWRFEDIARWTPSDVNRFSQALGVHGDRIEQENWIEQAQILVRSANAPATVGTGAEAAAAAAAVAAASAIDTGRPPAGAKRDRLTRIVGVTPDFEALLNLNGITRFSQIAAWTPAEASLYEGKFGYQPGRIAEENWIGQAQVLERGGDPDAASRPAKLADAIRDNADKTAGAGARAPLTGLRSVKSEALIDPDIEWSGQSGGVEDDLKRIRGIGVLIEKKLKSLGITSYEQVANWTGADVDRLSQILDFKGRIERENWIEQARILASGGQTEFSRRLDKGDV